MQGLGELEGTVMDVLWRAYGPMSVREMLIELNETRNLAYTTVMTVMDNLHRKDFLRRERAGRAFRYWPTQDRAEYTAELMHELLSGSGDSSTTLLRFLDQMSSAEVSRLKQALGD